MKKIILFIVLIIGYQCINIQAQSKFDVNKLVLGGTFGGNFSNSYTVIKIAPQVGYRLTQNFTAGTGLNYYYYSQSDFSAHYFGLNVYGRYTLLNYIMLQAQPEINFARYNYSYSSGKTYFVPSVLLGAGLRFGNFYGMLQYDVLQTPHTPYNGIVYSIGVIF